MMVRLAVYCALSIFFVFVIALLYCGDLDPLFSGLVDSTSVCPSSSLYTPGCLEYALPPWPICWFHSADYFVEKSIDGARRCCGDDTSECRCPKQDTTEFQDGIVDWCKGIREYCVPCKQDGSTMCNSQRDADKDYQSRSSHETEESVELVEETTVPYDHFPVEIPKSDESSRILYGGKDDRCPWDDTYEDKCLESAIPPYPICTKRSVEEWVNKALVGYDRCCGAEPGRCRCPKKESSKFASKIGDWCAGIETCSSPSSTTTTMMTGSLRTSKERLEVAGSGGE